MKTTLTTSSSGSIYDLHSAVNSTKPGTLTGASTNYSFAQILESENQKFKDSLTLKKDERVTYSPTSVKSESHEEMVYRKLAELRKIHEETDYSVMEKAEAYVTIEKRFEEAFPDEFHIAYNFGLVAYGLPEYGEIASEFNKQKLKYQGDFATFEQKNKYRGYEGMTYEEIEDAIYEKYEGKNTVKDQLNLLGELVEAGVTIHKSEVNNLQVHPLWRDAVSIGIIDKYGLALDPFSNKNPRDAFNAAMSGEISGISDILELTKSAAFVTPDVFEVFEKIFERREK
jgi:hypothetical protein